jgi:Group II intron, maturase-specific domain
MGRRSRPLRPAEPLQALDKSASAGFRASERARRVEGSYWEPGTSSAEESLTLVSRWLEKLGLTIHPTKTRLCHAREEPFDFLGYTFGPARHWQTGKRILSARPSKRAQKRLKEKINAMLFRGNPTPWPELCTRLNRLLSGWAEYFSFGFTGQADDAIGWHVRSAIGHRSVATR